MRSKISHCRFQFRQELSKNAGLILSFYFLFGFHEKSWSGCIYLMIRYLARWSTLYGAFVSFTLRSVVQRSVSPYSSGVIVYIYRLGYHLSSHRQSFSVTSEE